MNDKWALDSNKCLWHMDRIHKHFIQGKRIVPVTIDIGITKMCNIRCEYCYGIFQKLNGQMIPADALVRLFHDAPKIGVKGISIVGDGEPTLHPALGDAILTGHNSGLDMGMATNGVHFTPGTLPIAASMLKWLRFTVSGVGENYKVVHGVDRWQEVQKNISDALYYKKCSNADTTIGLQMVLTKNAFKSVIDEAKFAIDAGVDYFVVKQCSDPKCAGMTVPQPEWFDDPDVRQTLEEAQRMSTERTKIIVKFNAIATRYRRPYNHCYDVPLLFQVSGDGKCYPCGYLFGNEKYCYGDLCKQSLGEILDSAKYWAIVKEMQTTFDVHKDCAGHCRHQSSNEFMEKFLHPPEHRSFL